MNFNRLSLTENLLAWTGIKSYIHFAVYLQEFWIYIYWFYAYLLSLHQIMMRHLRKIQPLSSRQSHCMGMYTHTSRSMHQASAPMSCGSLHQSVCWQQVIMMAKTQCRHCSSPWASPESETCRWGFPLYKVTVVQPSANVSPSFLYESAATTSLSKQVPPKKWDPCLKHRLYSLLAALKARFANTQNGGCEWEVLLTLMVISRVSWGWS